MYGLNVFYKAKKGKREAFLSAIKQEGIDELCRAEAGCMKYAYYLSDSDENELLLVEKWKTKSDQALHATQPHTKRLQELKAIYIENTQLQAYDL